MLFLHIGSQAQEATEAHKDSLRKVVEEYYSLNLEIFEQNSTRADIDKLFNLFTDDFVYVHPRFGGEYSRKGLYEGYLNNQKNGNYDGSIVDVSIENMIIGLNAIVTERAYLQQTETGKAEKVDPGMTLFEFRNGKISKIFEYW